LALIGRAAKLNQRRLRGLVEVPAATNENLRQLVPFHREFLLLEVKAETVDRRLKKLLCNDGGNLSPFMPPANDSSIEATTGGFLTPARI
jgi:hypothetical protein